MAVDVFRLSEFCDSWLQKADRYWNDDLSDLFDRFFTLYVVYNRLYMELGRILVKREAPILRHYITNRRFVARNDDRCIPVRPLPDRFSATELVAYYLENNEHSDLLAKQCKDQVSFIARVIKDGVFYFSYDYYNDRPDTEKDEKNAKAAMQYKLKSVLEIVYLARCNMFHGSKEFHNNQAELLKAMNDILKTVIDALKAPLIDDIKQSNYVGTDVYFSGAIRDFSLGNERRAE